MIHVLLASKSAFRKQMLEREHIPFHIFVSDADETPNPSKSFEGQLKEISMRKAQIVFKKTIDLGERVIVAADQNIDFENVMFGKPKTLEEARDLIVRMQGHNDIYAYVGNSLIYANGAHILKTINNCDIAKMRMDHFSKEELEEYLSTKKPLTKCGGIHITDTPSLSLEEGKMSTAYGMTIEYLKDLLSSL